MRIGLAADHAGIELRDILREHIRSRGHEVVDHGGEPRADDDYPLIVTPLARAVAAGEVDRAIFCCGSGIGPAVAANKIPAVRAAVVTEEWSARDAVSHVDVNLLTLGQRVIGSELAKSIVDAFLDARPEGGRHARRREQIEALETDPNERHRRPQRAGIEQVERGSGLAGPSESASSGARAAKRGPQAEPTALKGGEL